MTKGHAFFLFILALLFFSFLKMGFSSKEYTYVSGSAVLKFNTNEAFTLRGNGNKSVTFTVETGTLYATASIRVYSERGRLALTSVDAVTLNATSLDPDNFDLRIDGGTSIMYENHTYFLTIPFGINIIISWKFYPSSPIDDYFMLGEGLVGLGMMIFSPCWVTWEIKKHGVSEVAVERFGYAMLLFLVGFGLIVMYLWSA